MNPDPKDVERFQKIMLTRMKISLFINMGWGLVALFLMVGLFVNRDAAVMGMMMVAVVWVQLELLARGLASWQDLKDLKVLAQAAPPPGQDAPENDGEDGK